jgi:hypothetical protein
LGVAVRSSREPASRRNRARAASFATPILSGRFAVALLALLLRAVAAAGQESAAEPMAAAELARIEALGEALYERDRAAWRATDALFAAVAPARRTALKGWIVTPDESGWRVRFAAGEGASCALFDVPVAEEAGPVREHSPCKALTATETTMFRARQAAIAALDDPCSERYNTVVLPAEMLGREGWLVYLLAATTTPGEVVIGGHKRIHLSADGGTVLASEALSNSCLTLELPPKSAEGGAPEFLAVTHVLSAVPSEIHTFVSLLHGLPLYVLTSDGVWEVSSGKIRYRGGLEELGLRERAR